MGIGSASCVECADGFYSKRTSSDTACEQCSEYFESVRDNDGLRTDCAMWKHGFPWYGIVLSVVAAIGAAAAGCRYGKNNSRNDTSNQNVDLELHRRALGVRGGPKGPVVMASQVMASQAP